MQVSQGILTVRGGMTSHAAVVARGMGTCCVSGCGNDNTVAIDYDAKVITINGHTFHEGDWMSIDGSTGNIYEGPDRYRGFHRECQLQALHGLG